MATTQIASMLDELMGRNRNFLSGDLNARELKWTDPDVCRYFVVDFCPHDLFTNTKADLGPCTNIHDEAMKQKFKDDKDAYKKSQYQDDFLRFCQRMLSDLQNRIKRAKERLVLTQQNEERMLNAGGTGVSGGLNAEADEQVVLLSEKIAALIAEAEEAGNQGNVEQAQGLMKLCDQLREERGNLRRSVLPANAYKDEYNVQPKAMEVCETCGAFLIVGDAQQRIDDHLLGKQHMGYSRLRAAIDKVLEEKKKAREEREKDEEERRKKREEEDSQKKSSRDSQDVKKRGGSRDERRHRSRSRDRGSSRRKSSRSRERRRRSRERSRRSRERSPVRDRRRSASRERRRRSRSRDKSRNDRRSRSPKSGDRNRERRNRSRSRDRGQRKNESRSRSREHHRKDSSRSRSREHRRKESSRSRSQDKCRKDKSRSRSRDKHRSSKRSRSRSQTSPASKNNGDKTINHDTNNIVKSPKVRAKSTENNHHDENGEKE